MHNMPLILQTKSWSIDTIQKTGLLYVYGGNVDNQEMNTTFCHHCKKPIITRRNLSIKDSVNIDNEGKCVFCSTQIPVVFDKIDF